MAPPVPDCMSSANLIIFLEASTGTKESDSLIKDCISLSFSFKYPNTRPASSVIPYAFSNTFMLLASLALPICAANLNSSLASLAISLISPSWAPPFCIIPSSISSLILSAFNILFFGSNKPAKLVDTASANLPVLPTLPLSKEKKGILVKFLTCAPGERTVLPYCDAALTPKNPVYALPSIGQLDFWSVTASIKASWTSALA